MSMDPIPRNLIAVHDLLLEMLGATNDTGAGWNYGIALFPRELWHSKLPAKGAQAETTEGDHA